MGIYARRSWKLAWQVASDAFVLVWVASWYAAARFVDGVVLALAVPARKTAEAAGAIRDQLHDAAEQAAGIPLAGGQLRKPLDGAAGGVGDIASNALQQAAAIEHAATVFSVLVFLVPVLIVVSLWLPVRIRFFLRQRAAQRFVDAQADLELFALRAMATQPMDRLARISPDPVAAWRSGDREVIGALAELELRKSGLSAGGIRRTPDVHPALGGGPT